MKIVKCSLEIIHMDIFSSFFHSLNANLEEGKPFLAARSCVRGRQERPFSKYLIRHKQVAHFYHLHFTLLKYLS